MTRFFWHEFRTAALVVGGLLTALAVVLAVTGVNLTHLYDLLVVDCRSAHDCSIAVGRFLTADSQLQVALDVAVVAAPALIGVFWGAPLVAREMERQTFVLAWTQSVTRSRWLAAKLGVAGTCSVLSSALLSLMVTWWFRPIDLVNANPFSSFDARDLVPIGYAAFAFCLGVAAGALLRRTLPAMVSTLLAFAVVRVAVLEWVRPNLLAPLHRTVANATIASLASLGSARASGTSPGPNPGSITPAQLTPGQGGLPPSAWLLSDRTINAAGQTIGHNGLVGGGVSMWKVPGGHGLTIQGAGTCPGISVPGLPSGPEVQACVNALHIRDVLAFQPADRYWTLQGLETAIFLLLALALAGLTFYWIQRRAG